jgi:hypothetical protein
MPRVQPLQSCPRHLRKRYQKASEDSQKGLYRASVKLKCLDCCGWTYRDAKSCQMVSCALWGHNRRIFGRISV